MRVLCGMRCKQSTRSMEPLCLIRRVSVLSCPLHISWGDVLSTDVLHRTCVKQAIDLLNNLFFFLLIMEENMASHQGNFQLLVFWHLGLVKNWWSFPTVTAMSTADRAEILSFCKCEFEKNKSNCQRLCTIIAPYTHGPHYAFCSGVTQSGSLLLV